MSRAGIDVPAVRTWLSERTVVTGSLKASVVAGGRSNLTYLLADDDGRRWVLRRPPLHGVLESAHDVAREHRIMAALHGSDVPVPTVVDLEEDTELIGAPFYVMDFVEGLVPRDASSVTGGLSSAARLTAAMDLADTLADLHAVDADAVGLGELGRREDYVARQLRRWLRQYRQGAIRDLPLVEELHDHLAASIPAQGPPAIVHGDYRLDNVIVGPDGRVRAVLDWELCTLGDPRADLGLLVVYWQPWRGEQMPGVPATAEIEGMPPVENVLSRYAERAGRAVSDLPYFVAFAYWRLAVILEGVHARHASGAHGDVGDTHEVFGRLAVDLLEMAAAATAEG